METNNIETLQTRRKRAIDNFIFKNYNSARFGAVWFPERINCREDLRNKKKYVETKTKTTRYYNAPLSFMRRRLNEMDASGELNERIVNQILITETM